jgi:transcriptional antiterminator
MRDAGHPRLLNQYDLADEFGVNQSTISRDLSRIAESISEYPSTHRDLETKTVIERCIVGLLEDEEWRAAARTQLDFNEWLNEHEKLAELEERLDALDTSCGLGSDYRIK